MTAWSKDPLGRNKNGWCLSVVDFPGIGQGKLAENREFRCLLSALCCNYFPGMGPTKDRSMVRQAPPNPGGGGRVWSALWELLNLEFLNSVTCLR